MVTIKGEIISIVELIIVGVILTLWILCFALNPYKSKYQKQEPLSYEEAQNEYIWAEGYPAGEDIPVAKSIADIKNKEYCTIEVSKENIESTRLCLIKDVTEAGEWSSGIGKSHGYERIPMFYRFSFNIIGDFLYDIRQVLWNLDNTSYGEWCVVTLENGERIYVLVDLKLLDIPKHKKIKLPIGTVDDAYRSPDLSEKCEFFGVKEENSKWYVDMVGEWEESEVGDINVWGRFSILLVLGGGIMIYIFDRFLVRNGYGEDKNGEEGENQE